MIKKEKGVTLVSLIITIIVMTILASSVIYISMDRFEVNNLRKMINDIELLQDKVSNYYLKYDGLPVVRDDTNTPIQYTYTILNFEKNSGDNSNYYILDLNAMEGIALNYGKEGFENTNGSDDVYIINEGSHTVYYVKGIQLQGQLQHYLNENAKLADNIPPSSPQINVILGTKATDEDGNIYYTTDVEIEIIPGKDGLSGVAGTQYSLDNGTTWTELGISSKILDPLTEDGSYTIKAKSYDKLNNVSTESNLTIIIDKSVEKELFSFEIDGNTYSAEKGMTWDEWLNSSYNTDSFTKSASLYVCNGAEDRIYCDNGDYQRTEYEGEENLAGICRNCGSTLFYAN